MTLESILDRLGLAPDAVQPLLQAVDDDVPEDWRHLAAAVAHMLTPGAAPRAGSSWPWPRWDEVHAPLVLGVAGAQGTGKSTLAGALVRCLGAAGARAVTCSLDDFYLSGAARRRLAHEVHPLLATRGVPGTHDVALLRQVIDALGERNAGEAGAVMLPAFDKGADEPLPRERWRQVRPPVNVLVLEGWCVGAAPEPAASLATPVNELEAQEDAHGVWRHWVNDQLAGPYRAVWRTLHGQIYLQIPDFAAVARWRGEQEQALPAQRRMSEAALTRFIAHYQRLTTAMLRTLPQQAGLVARLDGAHRLAELGL